MEPLAICIRVGDILKYMICLLKGNYSHPYCQYW